MAKIMVASIIFMRIVAYGALALANSPVFVDLRSFAVLGGNATFRESAFNTSFNPTATTPPFFQVFDRSFLSILGSNPSIHQIADSNSSFVLAHEGPIYDHATDEVFFVSNHSTGTNSKVGKISLRDVDAALAAAVNNSIVNVHVTELNLPDAIQMTNGGTGPYKSSLLYVTSGNGPSPPSIVLINPMAPHNATVLLDNYFGRQFNSLNDIKVHPSGNFFVTDTTSGFMDHFRPSPLLPNQVYRFDPDAGTVRVVATDFDKCNGIAFTADGKTAYIGDTGASGRDIRSQTGPSIIYAFDVDSRTHVFKNRRAFAYVDAGIPDGIEVDLDGNVYAGCGDGVHVWNAEGTLLGKIFFGSTSANMIFTRNGRLVILAETRIFVADIAAKGIPPISP